MSVSDLYHRYLEGRLSEEELASFKEDVSRISDIALWEIMEKEAENAGRIKMSKDEHGHILTAIHKKIRKAHHISLLKNAAAILFLIVGLSTVVWFYHENSKKEIPMSEIAVAPGNKARITLSDGTKVEMNSGTIMHYAVEKHGNRNVIIKSGEAYFDVAKDAEHPFHITVADMKIQVLGTSFNVNAYGQQVITSLFTGKIQLSSSDGKNTHILRPGNKSIYGKSSHRFSITEVDKGVDLGWKNGYLIFNSMPLKDVLAKIELWYGVKIKLENPKFADDKLTGSFHNETLESVLNSLSVQYKFDYTTQKGVIIVK